jgi:hypothetical protein
MLATYAATYRDRHGEVATTITNDGKQLRMAVRGIELVGKFFDDFEPVTSIDAALQAGLSFFYNDLSSCVLECDIPVPVVCDRETLTGNLHVWLDLSVQPASITRGPDPKVLRLTLTVGDQSYTSGWASPSFFEDKLTDIQAALPEGMYIKCCFTCAFSDYSPYGNGLFGNLACFRDNKEAYHQVRTKHQLFAIWDTHTEFVQETYMCPEYERREPGAGYRG